MNPCVVIPIYRLPLTREEERSLFSLNEHLAYYPRVIVAPKSFSRQKLLKYGSMVSLWSDRYFESVETYSRLMLNADFYEQHTTWSHMLIFQLDCLLFKDELLHWCNSPWDYIGAPWFRGFLEKNRNAGLWAVGNGGFSLRKVSSFLKVLRAGALDGVYRKPYDSPHYGLLPDEGELIDSKRGVYRELLPAWERWPMVGHDWNVEQEAQRYMYNEDAFWSFEAMKFDPSFKVATVDEGLKFAFEMNPDWCLKQNGGMLPFGCHAWTRYNRAFWEEIIT